MSLLLLSMLVVFVVFSCSLNEKQYTSGKSKKHTIDGDSAILAKLLLKHENITGSKKGEYVVEYTTSGKLSSSSQIEGKVVDANNNEPLPFANIWIVDTHYGTVTDLNGEFFLILIPPNTYSVQAKLMGYKTLTAENIVVQIGKVCVINFKLQRKCIE